MNDKWRWTAAHHMNRIPNQCWAGLVSWALRSDLDDHEGTLAGRAVQQLPWRPEHGKCSRGADFNRNGCCYCGKFRDMTRPDVAAIFKEEER